MRKGKMELNQIDYHIENSDSHYLVSYFMDSERTDRTIWGIRITDKKSGYFEVREPFVGHTPTQNFAMYHLARFRDGNRGKARK